ncbi:MAG: DNA helicase RecQ, partial [Lactobacillales bacterium]|nr:DNA helicase RecQ [Lactobacillales bacterium]
MINHATKILENVFGYKSFKGPQKDIIEHLLKGGDALVLMPTGGGKSLCYQIPALYLEGMAIVVSPLIALMQDQIAALQHLGIKAESLNSTLDFKEVLAIEKDIENGRLKLLYVSPEKLKSGRLLDLLKKSKISLFAIDEAHCISQWGHDFRPEYTQFALLKEQFPTTPIIALTATADMATRKDIVKNLHLQKGAEFICSFDRPNIEYTVKQKDNEKKQLLDFIKTVHMEDSGIVYCLSRKKTEEIAAFLNENGCKAYAYHAGMNDKDRAKTQRIFTAGDNVIIVATIAFGMGINKPDVRFVAHMDLPKSIESYYQETGRAGRDGLPADAFMVYGLKDIVQLRRFIDESDAPEKQKRLEHSKLNSLIGYAETPVCRRKVLLEYFGETLEKPCNHCDNCQNPPLVHDATQDMLKLLSCIYRTSTDRFAYGSKHIIDVLRGKQTDKITAAGHNTLSTFNIGAEMSEVFWKTLIREAIIRRLAITDEHGALRLTPAAYDFFKNPTTINVTQAVI